MTNHPITRRQFNQFALASAAAAASASIAAQTATKRPEIAKIFVPFAAGGTLDQIARILGEQLRGDVADTLVVENKSGAAGRIAIDVLRAAPADGTTLMVHAGGLQSLYPHTFKQLSYDPFVDVIPVSLTNRLEFGFAVGVAVPAEVRTLPDYITWVKADPKRSSFATPGSGTPPHFLPMLLGRDIKVEMNPVHYRGTSACFPDVLGGSVPAMSGPVHDLVQQLPGGKLRIIATSGATRNKLTPNVGTYAEYGFPQLTSSDWYAVYVSGKTPPALVEQISASVRRALAMPAVALSFSKAYIEPVWSTPAEAMRFARADNAMWASVVKTVGYVPE